ncbi:1-acyl-sn-glycerol-3-phosphate acyltransferase [Lachnoclostridium sp. An14]|uniref:lysophospholipid acyltransferase family protein n=1 Tax=Lachnoclostridium sp. An14 TaxID=1965562 RepID=UPI000B3749B5|nr:lysophospholipid acyltransferase family protein [Lachnoclostridium sp. An14]OUQ15479.1 1-acyl-sn-glycerol-3-phosphate acyltransferase [Lachnoclostridium sp. An14]
MIRFILVALSVILFLIFSIPILVVEWLLGRRNPERKSVQSLHIVQFMFRYLLRVSGVEVTVRGQERIPADTSVLYVGNHRSYFDILVGYTTVPGLTGFVAKKEMTRYLLLRDWMRNVNCLFLDRDNMKEGLKTILEGIEKIKAGISVWIFPEGTRSRGENELDMLEFKEGSLKIAEKSGHPVVPVAITGTADVFEKHIPFIRPAHVIIEYGEPIYIKQLEPAQRKFAGAYTREVLHGMLEKQLEERETWR